MGIQELVREELNQVNKGPMRIFGSSLLFLTA